MDHKSDPKKQDRGSAEPMSGRCGAKLRKSDPPRYCLRFPVDGRDRCRVHGGATPGGIASVHLKTGRHSRYLPHLPENWAKHYGDSGPDLVSLHNEIELNLTAMKQRIASVTASGKKAAIETLWTQLEPMLDMHLRLVAVESRRLKEQQELVQRSEFARFAQAVLMAVAMHVLDPGVKAKIQADTMRLLGIAAPPVIGEVV